MKHIARLARKYSPAALAVTGFVAATNAAHAAVDADLTEMVTDSTTLFGSVKTYVIAVVIFSIGIAIVKMIRKGK